MHYISLIIFLMCLPAISWAQAHETPDSSEHKDHHYKNMLSIELGHAHLSEGFKDGQKQWLVVPSWAINYNRIINHKWKAGLHIDIILEEFKVTSNAPPVGDEEETIERSYPISLVAAASYKPIHWLSLIGGLGAEYAPEETFALIRLGVEPGIEISPKWELVFSVVYDIKVDAYNNWNLGVGVARLF